MGVMETGVEPNRDAVPEFDFDAFYEASLPIVYGYLLRLCGGDHDKTRDLTQDTWVKLVDELNRGHLDKVDVRWLITVARSRFLDSWRRDRRRQRDLRLVWFSRGSEAEGEVEPDTGQLVEHLAHLSPEHRVVMTLHYVDGLPVSEVATLMGRSTPATYSLLSRARGELRARIEGSR
jgi:RNA polymerase sigma-70 factor (ECF subfamily)